MLLNEFIRVYQTLNCLFTLESCLFFRLSVGSFTSSEASALTPPEWRTLWWQRRSRERGSDYVYVSLSAITNLFLFLPANGKVARSDTALPLIAQIRYGATGAFCFPLELISLQWLIINICVFISHEAFFYGVREQLCTPLLRWSAFYGLLLFHPGYIDIVSEFLRRHPVS